MQSRSFGRELFMFVVVLVSGLLGITPRVQAQAVVSLAPRQGEIRLSGSLTEVAWKQRRCVLLATHVLVAGGTESTLPQPKSKTILLDSGTTYAMIAQPDNRTPILWDDAAELQRGGPAVVIGRNGPNGVVIARVICLLGSPAPSVVEETREPSEPAGKNLLLPTDRADSWGWTVMEPAHGTLEREEGAIKVTVTDTGKEDWRVQLSQTAVFPEPGVSYTLSFRARAEPARRMRLSAQVLDSDFHDIGINRVATIGPEWNHYEYTFIAHNLGAKGHIFPVFFFGTEKGTTWLADVTVAVSYPEQRGNLLEPVSNPAAWKLVPLTKEGKAALRIAGDRLEIGTSVVGTPKQETAYQLLPTSATPLLPGRSYVLTFRARSGDERTVRIRGIAEPLKLSPEERSFEVRFRVNRLTDFGVCPTFVFGEQLGTFSLRNLTLREERDDKVGKVRSGNTK
jgi:hypothetical protein